LNTWITARRLSLTVQGSIGDKKCLKEQKEVIEMASYSFVVPVLPGKTETVRPLSAEASGPRRSEMEEFQRRVGITKQEVWLQQTPNGDMAAVNLETNDAERLFRELASSDKPFDCWYVQQLKEIYGIDTSQPLPQNELTFEWPVEWPAS
jgi:hypothetical protein